MTDNFQLQPKNVWLSDVFRLIAKSVDHIPEDADVNVNGEIYNCREALCAYLSMKWVTLLILQPKVGMMLLR